MKPRASAATTRSTAAVAPAPPAPTRPGRARRVQQQRRDVLEDDPRPREVRDVADERSEVDGAHRRMVGSRLTMLAQVADQQQVPQVRRHRRQVLERLDRLLAALGIARAQGRGEDALKQLRLAVGRAAEHAQVAPADAVARELRDGADDLPLGLVVVARPASDVALDHAEFDQLADQRRRRRRSPRRRPRASTAPPGRGWSPSCAAARGRRPAAATSRSVRPPASSWRITRSGRNSSRCRRRIVRSRWMSDLRVEPIAALRAPRREQLLILEVADLGDRDVGELLDQRLADGADRHRLLARAAPTWPREAREAPFGRVGCLGGRHHRLRNASLYLPTWSSSPSASRWDSIRLRLT